MTDQNLIEQFCTYLEHNLGRSSGTARSYRSTLFLLVVYLDATGLLQASEEQLTDFCGLYAHKRGVTPRSRCTLIAAVRGFYKWAYKTGRATDHLAKHIQYPQIGRRLPLAMSLAHAERLIMAPGVDTFLGLRDTAILSVLIGCGLRVSGVCGLNESSFVIDEDKGRERLALRVSEKGKKERYVPAPEEARLLIHAYLGHENLEDIDRTLKDGDRVLFVSTNNRKVPVCDYFGEARRLRPNAVRNLVLKWGKKAGLPKAQLHPHALRHLYGAELGEENIDLLQRQALLGHEDPKTTEIYTHLAYRRLRQAADKANPLRKIRSPASALVKELHHGNVSPSASRQ